MRIAISLRTRLVAVGGIAVIAASYALILAGVGGDYGVALSSDLGGLVIDVLASFVVLSTALAFQPGEPLRRQWMAFGIGVALFTAGDAAWSYIELVQRADVPYPGVPDFFYVPVYAAFAFGLFTTALAYRRLVSIRVPLIGTGVVVAALGGGLIGIVLPALSGLDVSPAEQALSVFYPLADLLLLLMPAVFVLFVIRYLRGGALAWPWYSVAVGLAVLGMTDTAFSWLEALELYETGMLVDIGWMAGYLLIAVGASLARDVMLAGRVRTDTPAEDAAA